MAYRNLAHPLGTEIYQEMSNTAIAAISEP